MGAWTFATGRLCPACPHVQPALTVGYGSADGAWVEADGGDAWGPAVHIRVYLCYGWAGFAHAGCGCDHPVYFGLDVRG
jgi:hypothetical protein